MTPELVRRGLASSKASERRSAILSLTARDVGEEKLGELFPMLPLFASEDPDPRVRIAAMKVMVETHESGLYPLNKESCQKVERLLDDKNDDVRLHATRVLSHWGFAISQQIAAGSAANLFLESDKSFLQVSSMVCDMSKSVRAEACRGLALFCGGVSEEVLLQSLAKKMVVSSNFSNASAGKSKGVTMLPPQPSGEVASEAIKAPPAGPTLLEKRAAGAFVQGLEDEYMEVRMEAAQSLAQHCLAFPKMVESGAAELLVDTLNDEMPAVRTMALQSLFSLAQAGCLQLPPDLLVLVVAVADGTQPGMRHLAQRLLSLLPLASIEELRSILRALLANLQRQPRDRPGIFDALYALGKRHTSLVQCIVNDLLHEARTLLCAPQGLEDPCYAALLVLVLSAVGEDASLLSLIPPQTLRHACILRSRVPHFRSLGFEFRTAGVGTAVFSSSSFFSSPVSSSVSGPRTPPRERASEHAQAEDMQEEMAAVVQALVRKALEAGKGATAAGHVGRSLLMLRECEQGLGRLSLGGTDEATAALVRFSQLFVRSLRALTRAQQLLSEGGGELPVVGGGTISNLASELDRLTRRMRCCFARLSRPLALIVAELSVVAAFLPFASDDPPPHTGAHGPPVPSAGPEPPPPPPTGPAARARLEAASASAEHLSREVYGRPGGVPLVASAAAVAAAAAGMEESGKVAGKRRGWSPEDGRSAVSQYWPTDVDVRRLDLRETWAEVLSPACNKDEPVEFVPGLPLGISIVVAVHNPPPEGDLGRLWVMLELFGRPPLFQRLCTLATTDTTRIGSGLHVRPDSSLEIEMTAIVHGLPAMNTLAIGITLVLAEGGDTRNALRYPEESQSNGMLKRKREEIGGRFEEAEGTGSSGINNNKGEHAGFRGMAGRIVALSKRRECYLALGKDRTTGKASGAQTSGVK